ncbi:MAG TPA: rhodanese-like domain-containing protein [Candidatus Krumholzibacteria bacterium]|nr:rhodanese-like domain-containing protein [Candidatus Krumholzibacteria bacterium]
MFFRQVYDPKLSQYAYVIGCQATGEAIVVDPLRDVESYLEIAKSEGLRLVAVAETHIHADFLSGARELCERAGVTAYVSGEGGADWQSEWLKGSAYQHRVLHDGDHFMVGNIRFDVIHTPGHTPEHVCYTVTDTPARAALAVGILSGDFVFVGDVGRPDLLETAAGQAGAMEPSARALFRSIEKFRALPPALQLWPAHGAGSACGKALGAVPVSTVGYELAANASIGAATDPESFLAYILEGQPEPPLYFARMKRDNRGGPAVLGKMPEPKPLAASKLVELERATGVALLDLRSWDAYKRAHVPGSLFTPLNRAFNTVAGSYVPEGMAIYLIVDEKRVREATVDLVRVGLDRVIGYATPAVFDEYVRKGKPASIAEIDATKVEAQLDAGAYLLDVRRAAERAERGQIAGSHNIAYERLLARVGEIPKDRPVVVHCQGGTRSAYAAGLLDRMGYSVTNVAGGYDAWKSKAEVAKR